MGINMKILKKKNEDKIYSNLSKLLYAIENNRNIMKLRDYCDSIDCTIDLASKVLSFRKFKQLRNDYFKFVNESRKRGY